MLIYLLVQIIIILIIILFSKKNKLENRIIILLLIILEGFVTFLSIILSGVNGPSFISIIIELSIIYYFLKSFDRIDPHFFSILIIMFVLTLVLVIKSNFLFWIYGFRWFLVPFMFMFVILDLLKKKSNSINQIKKVLLFGLFFSGLLSIQQFLIPTSFDFEYLDKTRGLKQYEYTLSKDSIGESSYFIEGKIRSYGTFTSNLYNVFFGGVIFNLLLLYFNINKKTLFIFSSPYILYLLVSLDRTGIALLLIPMLTNSFISANSGKKILYIVLLSIIFILYINVYLNYLSQINLFFFSAEFRRFVELTTPLNAHSVSSGRLIIWNNALNIIYHNFLGMGLGTTIDSNQIKAVIQPHNSWLQIIIEIGIIGFISFLLFHLLVFVKSTRKAKISFLIPIWVAVGFFSLFNDGFYKTNAYFLMLINSLAMWSSASES